MKQLICLLLIVPFMGQAQLQQGFSITEYQECLKAFARQGDTVRYKPKLPYPSQFKAVYSSQEVGLKNQWSYWENTLQTVGLISIRGTVEAGESWLENFYAAMVPASGQLQLNDSTRFSYRLSADSGAMVHIGWLVGLGHLVPDITAKIKDAHDRGVRQFILFGHSQGAAITFLLRSYLYYQTVAGKLPDDIVYKTYCSAAPKPGNTNYVYDYDYITRNGWGFTIVNAADWVPQTPFSSQTLDDFPQINPFTNIDKALEKQSWLVRLYLKSKFRKMRKATNKARDRFEDYLGRLVYKQVRKYLPQYQEPRYAKGSNYQRAGIPIVLIPTESYWLHYPHQAPNVFIHHLLEPYYELATALYE
ncbi:MAG TPA: lipase family protein [Flavisolibacter sp.]|nr:lipase family protein [Flavisolibacter sp.]